MIEQTVKYDFNTGFYELFRCELEKIFSSLETTMRCVRIPVSDNKGNFAECIYKIYGTDGHLYTVNMYHTRSSSLVIGKNTSLFVQTHFVNVLESMEKIMKSTNTTVEEVNRRIKAILLQCRKINISKDTESDDCQRPSTSNQSAKLPLPSISETSEIVQEEKEDKIIRSNPMLSKPGNGRNIDSTTLNHTDSNDDLLNPILNDLLREISEVKDILLNHVHSTSRGNQRRNKIHQELM